MSIRSHDVRSHPWVGRLGEDQFGNKWGLEINEKIPRRKQKETFQTQDFLNGCVF